MFIYPSVTFNSSSPFTSSIFLKVIAIITLKSAAIKPSKTPTAPLGWDCLCPPHPPPTAELEAELGDSQPRAGPLTRRLLPPTPGTDPPVLGAYLLGVDLRLLVQGGGVRGQARAQRTHRGLRHLLELPRPAQCRGAHVPVHHVSAPAARRPSDPEPREAPDGPASAEPSSSTLGTAPSSAGTCTCTTRRRTCPPRPAAPASATSWARCSTSSRTRRARSPRTS